MKNKIKDNLNNPEQLEQLYRENEKEFENNFLAIYSEIAEYELARFWKIRLEFKSEKETVSKILSADIYFMVLACIITGFLIKIPQIFGIDLKEYFFYEKNAGLIVFFGLAIYAFFTNRSIKTKHLLISMGIFAVSALYINLLPSIRESHSINLAYIHLPLLAWSLYGIIYINFDLKDKFKRIEYIRHNGDLAILGAIIFIAGGILAGVTFGLFSAIDLQIEQFYMEYIVIWGLVSAPIVATFIIRFYPQITNKIAPIIANIFSPLVLATLVIYLASIIVTGKNPYNDRNFLIMFNLLLLGVMAIIVFSVSETSINKKQRFNETILFILSTITLLVDLIALSAIIYRLGEFGFTPNRTAVLGSNLLIFGNLVLITLDLYKVNFKQKNIQKVELTISNYLPVYVVWTIFVVFVLPFIFGLL